MPASVSTTVIVYVPATGLDQLTSPVVLLMVMPEGGLVSENVCPSPSRSV